MTAAGRCLEPGSGTHQLHRLGASSSLLSVGLHHIPVAESKHNKSLHTCPLVLRRKHFWFSAGLCFSMTAIPSKQKTMKAVKKQACGNGNHRMKTQDSFPDSKIRKKVKAHKATFKSISYLLTIDIPTHLIHLYCSSGVSQLPNLNVLIILSFLLQTIYQITQSRHMILFAENHMT